MAAPTYSNMTTIFSSTTATNYFRNVAESDLRSDWTIGLVAIIFVSIVLAILFGNIIVIIAILTYRQLKNQQSNLFILNLAFADLSVVVTVMIWTTIAFILDMGRNKSHPWIFTKGMCFFQCAMNYCLIVVSMMTLGFISIDRLVHIVYPLRYVEIITVKRIRIMICWTWIQGLIIGFIPVGMQWIHYDYCEVVCAIDWSSEHADKFVIVAFITCFIAPAITMLVCYSVIFKEISKSMNSVVHVSGMIEKNPKSSSQSYEKTGSLKKNSHRQQRYDVSESEAKNAQENGRSDIPQSKRMRRHNKPVKESTIVKSLLIVVLVFFVCMTPFSTTKLIKVLEGYIPCWVNTFATVVQLLSSACNPLIYGIFRKEYRKAFKIQYRRVCHRMQARFYSSEYSDSFNTPYYSDKPSTLKRKQVSKNMSISSVKSNSDHLNSTLTRSNNQLYPHQENASENSKTALYKKEEEIIGPQVEEAGKKYSLPRRAVSFGDTPDLINQTTEIVTL